MFLWHLQGILSCGKANSGDYRQVFYCYLVSNACDLSIRFIENGYNSVEPSISANGVMIVYVRPLNSGMDRLFLVNQASNRSLAITDLENIRYPSVSNNGVIAFGRDNSDGTTDLMLRSNGQVSSLFKSSKPLFHASISPDGQFLTYSYEVNGYRSLFMRDIVNNTEVQLGGGNWDYLAAYWQGNPSFKEQNVRAPEVQVQDGFGEGAIALQGNTAFVGAKGNSNLPGSVYVLKRVGVSWQPVKRIVASDSALADGFGRSFGH